MLGSIRRWYLTWVTHNERRLEGVFEGRSALSDDEFYQRYFAHTGIRREVALGVRRAFIDHIPFDMRRLAPDDSFGRELQFVWSHDSLADVELICQVEREFDVSITEAEGRKSLTMGALIALVDRKVTERTQTARHAAGRVPDVGL